MYDYSNTFEARGKLLMCTTIRIHLKDVASKKLSTWFLCSDQLNITFNVLVSMTLAQLTWLSCILINFIWVLNIKCRRGAIFVCVFVCGVASFITTDEQLQ